MKFCGVSMGVNPACSLSGAHVHSDVEVVKCHDMIPACALQQHEAASPVSANCESIVPIYRDMPREAPARSHGKALNGPHDAGKVLTEKWDALVV